MNITDRNKDELSIKEFLLLVLKSYRFLLRNKKFICLAVITGAIGGFGYAYFNKPVYTADCTFVLEEEKASSLSQYAGIASMVGIDLGGANGSLFQGDNIIELYKSRKMLEKTLLSYVTINGKSSLLIDQFLKFNKIESKTKEHSNFSAPRDSFTTNQDSTIGVIVKSIKKNNLAVSRPDKKLSIIKVEFKSTNEIFSKVFTETLVTNVNDFYTSTKTKKLQENLQTLQKQTDSVRNELNLAIRGVAASSDVNPNANSALAVLRVPSQKRAVDAEANKAILTELVKNLEIAKISLRKETPLIQVIDYPILPLAQEKLSKFKSTLIGSSVMGFLMCIVLLIRKFLLTTIS